MSKQNKSPKLDFQESTPDKLEKTVERKSTKVNRDIFKIMQDVNIRFHAEFGFCEMPIKKLKALGEGSIVEFMNNISGSPLKLFANDRFIGYGEAVVIDENFGIRIIDIVTNEESTNYHAGKIS